MRPKSSLLLGLLLLAGCAMPGRFSTPASVDLPDGPEFQLGGLTVIVLPFEKVHSACLFLGVPPRPGQRYAGCANTREDIIVTPPEFWIFMHELKHVLEPGWNHE